MFHGSTAQAPNTQKGVGDDALAMQRCVLLGMFERLAGRSTGHDVEH
jgi:hypothetical protein